MAGTSSDRSVPAGIRIGLPAAGGIALAATVGILFPSRLIHWWPIHPSVLAGGCWGGLLWYTGRWLAQGPSVERPWRHIFGVANAITLFRGGLYAVVAGFLGVPSGTDFAWIPALCYGSGIVLDKVDGTVARTIGEQTRLGTRLDMAVDTFGFVAAPLLAVYWGRLPVWYLLLASARFIYLGGIRWRQFRNRPVFERPDSDLGKHLAGVQMVFLSVALIPPVPPQLVFTAAPFVLLPSLSVFTRDYLVVSGRLPREWFERSRRP